MFVRRNVAQPQVQHGFFAAVGLGEKAKQLRQVGRRVLGCVDLDEDRLARRLNAGPQARVEDRRIVVDVVVVPGAAASQLETEHSIRP
jgi:hypothetical protein